MIYELVTSNIKVNKIIFKLNFWSLFFIIIGNLVSPSTNATNKEIYVYHRLIMKDLEQMDKFVQERIQKAKTTGQNKEELLYEALLTLFSRPNLDNLIEKIAPSLHAELATQDLQEKLYSQLITEALTAIKPSNAEKTKIETQLTYLIVLENWLVEFRPKIKSPEIKKWYQQIADNNIKLSKKQLKHAQVQMPYNLKNPSQLAKEILKQQLDK